MQPNIASRRVAIYARSATSTYSIEQQTQRGLEAIASSGGDASRALVFSDTSISGLHLDRPGLDALLHAVDRGSVDVVVTADASRFSRDADELARITERMRAVGVDIVIASDDEGNRGE
jgi:DNA invertase Pin-like site-specific DNA recombinase